MIVLTTTSRCRRGQKLIFLESNSTRKDFWGKTCTVYKAFNGGPNVSIQFKFDSRDTRLSKEMSPVNGYNRHTGDASGPPRFAILGETGFGNWFRRHGL